mgnify:CR=1 FL=1
MRPSCINLADQPISIKNYEIYGIDKLPKIVFGYKIKNKFLTPVTHKLLGSTSRDRNARTSELSF